MKKLYKYLSTAALGGVLCLGLSLTASAQRNQNNGGGGGSRSSSPSSSSVRVSTPPPAQQSRPAPSQNYSRQSVQQTRVAGSQTPTSQRMYGASRSNSIAQKSVISQTPTYNGHLGVAMRPGVNAQTYRTYQGSVYGKNHPGSTYGNGNFYRGGNNGNRGYYHYNHGYYASYYYPRLGFSVGFLPYGYYPFYFDDYQYFYSGGLFYQYDNNEYTVVEPPVGAEVTTLPANAQSIVINGQQYYEVNGVYYQPITKDDGTLSYQVAGKDGELNTADATVDNTPAPLQIGDIVNQLPDNCRKISINGEKLYVSPDGVYYKAVLDQDNNKVYKVVGLPADDDQNQGGGQGGN